MANPKRTRKAAETARKKAPARAVARAVKKPVETARKAAARVTASAARAGQTVKRGAKKTVVIDQTPGRARGKAAGRAPADVAYADPALFAPLTEGERAEALRILTEDARLNQMAKVGRYRVIAIEPLVVKPPHELVGRRLARLVVYDYASNRAIDASVDLDHCAVPFLRTSQAQPMLSRDEEASAITIALGDDRVQKQLSLGDEAQLAMHYWSNDESSLAYSRRSAAVIFGRRGAQASIVAVVDLLDETVVDVVPADEW